MLSYQSSLDHAAPATADHSPCIIVGNRRQAFAGDDEVERRNQIGRCIDQRAVEIEHDGAHDSVLVSGLAGVREQNYLRGTRIAAISRIHSLSRPPNSYKRALPPLGRRSAVKLLSKDEARRIAVKSLNSQS
jgi:hypothetical protein